MNTKTLKTFDKLLYVLTAFSVSLLMMCIGDYININSLNQTKASAATSCPPGSYEIGAPGEGICKKEPTGCPYGDSIPLGPECDKHAPYQPIEQPAVGTQEKLEAIAEHNAPFEEGCGK